MFESPHTCEVRHGSRRLLCMDASQGFVDALPIWARAGLWGALAGSGLLFGLLVAIVARLSHGAIARIMSFGAGVLFGTVSIQLTISAHRHAGATRATIFLLVGALLFSFVNLWLARAGAQHRKRCGECVAQENERERPGSGQAIAIGTIIDALPEGLVLGVAVAQSSAPTLVVVAGFFLANVPESISGSAGMYLAGRSMRYIFSVWLAATLVTPIAAVLGSVAFASASPAMAGVFDALSGGILLAMAAETMIPEAFEKAPIFSGAVAVLGFAVIAALTSVM
jgi:zinc transporter, ZIP family